MQQCRRSCLVTVVLTSPRTAAITVPDLILYSKATEDLISVLESYLQPHVHCSTVDNSQNMKLCLVVEKE